MYCSSKNAMIITSIDVSASKPGSSIWIVWIGHADIIEGWYVYK